MINIRTLNPVARAVGVIGAVSVLAVSVTFAALTSNSVVLADSEFSTQTASLQIWDGDSYDVTAPGFAANNLALSTPSSESTFWLKNNGTAALTVSGLGSLGSYSGFVDFGQVNVEVRNITTGSLYSTYTFTNLLDGTPDALPGNPLAAGAVNQYGVRVTINPAAVSGSSASVTGFDWTFTGTNP